MKNLRYTTTAYSHESLITSAKQLQLEKNIPLDTAKELIAIKIGYQNWQSIIDEPIDPTRDKVFHNVFTDKNSYQDKYHDFLKNNSLKDSSENYRRFIIDCYDSLQDQFLRYQEDKKTKSIMNIFHANGAEALLPQNLTDNLFQEIIDEVNYYNDLPEERVNNTLTLIVTLLSGHEEDANWVGELSILDILMRIDIYLIYLSFEQMKREDGVDYTPPTKENIFDETARISFKRPQIH